MSQTGTSPEILTVRRLLGDGQTYTPRAFAEAFNAAAIKAGFSTKISGVSPDGLSFMLSPSVLTRMLFVAELLEFGLPVAVRGGGRPPELRGYLKKREAAECAKDTPPPRWAKKYVAALTSKDSEPVAPNTRQDLKNADGMPFTFISPDVFDQDFRPALNERFGPGSAKTDDVDHTPADTRCGFKAFRTKADEHFSILAAKDKSGAIFTGRGRETNAKTDIALTIPPLWINDFLACHPKFKRVSITATDLNKMKADDLQHMDSNLLYQVGSHTRTLGALMHKSHAGDLSHFRDPSTLSGDRVVAHLIRTTQDYILAQMISGTTGMRRAGRITIATGQFDAFISDKNTPRRIRTNLQDNALFERELARAFALAEKGLPTIMTFVPQNFSVGIAPASRAALKR